MIKSKKMCKFEGCASTPWKKGWCRSHLYMLGEVKPPLKRRSLRKISEKQKVKNEEKALKTKELHTKFQEFYNSHPTKKCEQCGVAIRTCNSINMHHLLPKSIEKYKKVSLDDRFWILLCSSCHSTWELSYKGSEIAKRTIEAKQLFESEQLIEDYE